VAYAVWHNGFLELSRGEFAASRRLADELAVVAGENGYEVWATLATVLEGVSLTMMGQPEDGLRLTEAGIELYQGLTTPPVFWPYILLLRGMVHGHAGSVERGIELIDEAIAVLGPVGRVPPEFRVTRGDLLQRLPSPEEGEAMADYEIARHESAQMGLDLLELQAMTRIVGLRRQLGEVPDRADELRVVYDRFTEGFDEHDLTSARAVLGLERDTMGAGAGVKGPP
jgi:hypothetical protein